MSTYKVATLPFLTDNGRPVGVVGLDAREVFLPVFSADQQSLLKPDGTALAGTGGGGGSAADDIAFTTTVPLLNTAGTYMSGIQAVTGALTFVPAASPVRGAFTFAYIKANGANIPDVSAFTEHGSSMGYLNTANILNIANFFTMGGINWVSWSQAAVPVAIVAPTAVSLSGPMSGVINTATSNYTVGTDGVRPGAVTVTPTPVTGVTFTPSSVTLAAGTGTGTFTATSTTTGAKTIAVTNGSGLANPASITLTVAAAATVPSTMSAPVITAGDGSISIAWVAPAANGSAIIDATFTASTGQTATGTTSPTTMTVPNGTAVTVTGKARNGMGTAATASPASNSVTPAAAAAPVARFAQLSNVTESGTTPNFAYVGGAGAGGASYDGKGVLNLSLASGADGEIVLRVSAKNNEVIWGLSTSTTPVAFSGVAYGIYVSGTGAGTGTYRQITSGSPANGTVTTATFATNDYQRIKRIGTTITASKSSDGGATWTVYQTWTGASTAALYVNLNLNTAVAIDTITTVGLA